MRADGEQKASQRNSGNKEPSAGAKPVVGNGQMARPRPHWINFIKRQFLAAVLVA